MSNTYSQVYIHIVFAMKGRENPISESFRKEVQKYISGIISNLKQKLYALYCMPDHVHILVSIKPDCKISDLVRDIKANSSRFINEKHWLKQKFQWQEGYGAFTYSNSQLERVVNYIIHQPDYHKRKTFREEYEEILEQYGVDYKAEYLFEYYE